MSQNKKLPTPELVLSLFSEPNSEWSPRDLQRELSVAPGDRRAFWELLDDLVREDYLRLRKSRYYSKGPKPFPGRALPGAGGKDAKEGLHQKERRLLYNGLLEDAAWPRLFGPKVKEEAAALPLTIEECPADARDWRATAFVTIDPHDAKDFDDAVAAAPRPDGRPGYRLFVAIADVSRYVTPGSALENEAYARTTSVYLPGTVVPMLPFELSNGLCSLKPRENRCAFVATLDFDERGECVARSFEKGLIASHARLTYEEAQSILLGEAAAPSPETAASFAAMKGLFALMLERRAQRGTLELDIPEARALFSEAGEVIGIARSQHFEAHRLIEEFMVAANAAVAQYLTETLGTALYRVHDAPDPQKLETFAAMANRCGFPFKPGTKVSPGELNRFLQTIEGSDSHDLLHMMLLRSMKQAAYQTLNLGHFGLGLASYCHFTSPIRRYPDLLIHRLLATAINGPKSQSRSRRGAPTLDEAALHCSTQERKAMEIEHKALDICQAEFMSTRIGEEFPARVVGVTSFGLFVRVAEPFVEGLVHIGQLDDDYYEYNETEQALIGARGRRLFRMGDALTVRVNRCDVPLGRIDFHLIGVEKTTRATRPLAEDRRLVMRPAKAGQTARKPKGAQTDYLGGGTFSLFPKSTGKKTPAKAPKGKGGPKATGGRKKPTR